MLPSARMSEPASVALASFASELARLCPPGATVLDAHTHLGLHEEGQSLDLDDPDRQPDSGSEEPVR
jgi:hypothetical protein